MELRLKPTEVEVSAEDPFEHDALDRKRDCRGLTDLVRHCATPYVVAVDSGWGTGKTTFLKMWLQHLRNEGLTCIYFNAWENDHVADPFVALVAALGQEIDAAKVADPGKLHERWKKTKEVAAAVAKRALPVAARVAAKVATRVATGGAVDLDEVLEGGLGEVAEGIARDQLAAFEERRRSVKAFKRSLGELVESLGDGRHLVVAIDELDRCRPTFAVELLERVKHLFDVRGVVFVLAVDRSQLVHSVRALYGSEFDAQGYLRRFVDVVFRLPDPAPEKYPAHLVKALGVEERFGSWDPTARACLLRDLTESVKFLFPLAGLSLREQEQCIARIFIVLNTVQKDARPFFRSLVPLAVLREWDPDLYQAFADGRVDIDPLVDKLEGGRLQQASDRLRLAVAVGTLLGGTEEVPDRGNPNTTALKKT